jgi:hypothetical protein
MKDLPVSKKLIKYAWTREKHVIRRAELLLYADEVKRLEERLHIVETELAWENAHDTEEHIKYLQVKFDTALKCLKAWQNVFKCDGPWEAELKHKAEMSILSLKLEKSNEMVAKMFPTFWEKTCEIGETKFFRRKG